METGFIAAIVVASFVFLFFVPMFVAAKNMSVMMTMQKMSISPEDFRRLLDKEETPIVYYTKVAFGGYYYFATVQQDRICTKSKTELEFAVNCDLVPLKRV